jgi:UDP-N-acetylglucosamine 2-epimerase
MMGTEYLLRGRGGDISAHKGFNAQLLAVNYKPTINHMQAAPRTMTAILPVPESKVRLCVQSLCTAAPATQPASSTTV